MPKTDNFLNADSATVTDFGEEWSSYTQQELSAEELKSLFDRYFDTFYWDRVDAASIGFDLGSGSGRWARLVAPEVGTLHCVDASPAALDVARSNLAEHSNVTFIHASAGDLPFEPASMDFGYSLGVLHHIPDTLGGLRECARVLKPGAPFQLYLYYRFDNRPAWFRALWTVSDILRKGISELPHPVKLGLTTVIAALVYWPLARLGWLTEKLGLNLHHLPLYAYRSASFYTMRTDALDRFGTRLEQRFTRAEIEDMLQQAGFEGIRFSEKEPYWVCSALRRAG